MKKGKPRGPVPSLIGSTLGTPRRENVDKKSTCKRCGAALEKGTEGYAIPHLGGSFANYRRFCDTCYRTILEKTKQDLDELRRASDGI